jgi:hypothetical protein
MRTKRKLEPRGEFLSQQFARVLPSKVNLGRVFRSRAEVERIFDPASACVDEIDVAMPWVRTIHSSSARTLAKLRADPRA